MDCEHEAVTEEQAAWLALAAAGDRDAQVLLLDQFIDSAEAGTAPLGECAAMAELMGRLLVTHGRAADQYALIRALRLASEYQMSVRNVVRAAGYEAEVVALLNEMADDGDEDAGSILQMAADALPPELLSFAGRLKPRAPSGFGFVYQEG